ncbi:hypothetical protein [Ferrovibrio sp.]|uniref:hypothetical protein n=1 Tax=Ferrovibrio sp. TaxID=1917215 RepID=UPI00311F6204
MTRLVHNAGVWVAVWLLRAWNFAGTRLHEHSGAGYTSSGSVITHWFQFWPEVRFWPHIRISPAVYARLTHESLPQEEGGRDAA